MSVKRRDLIRYLEENGFYLLREGGNHFIYTNSTKVIPVKRHTDSIGSQPTKSASKQVCRKSSDRRLYCALVDALV